MDAKTFAQVSLRLLAVFLIFMGLVGLPAIVLALVHDSVPLDSKVDVRLYVASLASPMVLGAVAWIMSSSLARWMVGKDAAVEASVPLDIMRIQTVAFVVLGTWLAIKALSELLVLVANSDMHDPYSWQVVVNLALSVCLIIGAKSLARLARNVREFGAREDDA